MPTREWIGPVFDRVLSDCVYGNPKGSITVETLKRIENNILYLKELFTDYNIYFVNDIPDATDWDRQMYFKVNMLNSIKQSILNLRSSNVINKDTPMLTLSSAEQLQMYTMYNDMEKILFDIAKSFTRVAKDFLYCGEFFCGGSKDDQHMDEINASDLGTLYTADRELFLTSTGMRFITR